MKRMFILITCILLIISCNKQKKEDYYTLKKDLDIKEDNKINYSELKEIQNEIIYKVGLYRDYDNYVGCAIDAVNNNITIFLVENSYENQVWFLKNIIDSKYIKFEQSNHDRPL